MGDLEPRIKIRTKVIAIAITNTCNLSCGGCHQLIGLIPDEKLFHVPLAQVREHIHTAIKVAKQDWQEDWFPPRHRVLSLYGGEPTVHPEWPAILQMLYEEFSD